MKKSFVLSILLLALSLHACSAKRPISFSANKQQADNNEDLMKISTHEIVSSANKVYKNSNYEDNKNQQLLLIIMKRNNLKAEVQEYNKELDEINEANFQQASRESVVEDEEKWKRGARRSTLQSLPHGNNNNNANKPEETMNYSSNENEDPEQSVAMDYAQPHRKPPIHNKERP